MFYNDAGHFDDNFITKTVFHEIRRKDANHVIFTLKLKLRYANHTGDNCLVEFP